MKKIGRILVMLITMLVCINSVEVHAEAKINKKNAVMETGCTLKLKISGTSGKIKWASSDKTVAKVSSKGKVTAVKEGTAVISGTIDKKVYYCNVSVIDTNKATTNVNRDRKEEGVDAISESSLYSFKV